MPKVEPIFLTPENVDEYQDMSNTEHQAFHMEVNMALEAALPNESDAGCLYAKWLNDIGIDHLHDEGNWGAVAVDLDNMQCFVDCYYADAGDELLASYDRLKSAVGVIHKAFDGCGYTDDPYKVRYVLDRV